PGYFASAFAQRGASYVGLEPDVGEMAAAGIEVAQAVRGNGTSLPFADDIFDITYSSNVAEHIPNPWDMGEEMLRVTKP
ncbi:class I SAM-dependent methyltransferase, partial [Lacticaseibacillus rhamnosus]